MIYERIYIKSKKDDIEMIFFDYLRIEFVDNGALRQRTAL